MDSTPTLRVIGAGFGRTGTSSLKVALEQLGFGPCHHMDEVIKHPAQVPTWEAGARGETVDWVSFLRGWGSAVDFPAAFYYRELMAAFPEAKVILTVRDAESWYTSFRSTIYAMIGRFPNRIVVPLLPAVGGAPRVARVPFFEKVMQGRFEDPAFAMKVFSEHTETVKEVVPADRLLVFDVKEGWEPLCRFLQVPVPPGPFPRVNDTAVFQKRTAVLTAVSWGVMFAPVALLAGIAAWLL